MEIWQERLLSALRVVAFIGCAALVVVGQKTISFISAGLMMLGLAGMLLILWIYNRKQR